MRLGVRRDGLSYGTVPSSGRPVSSSNASRVRTDLSRLRRMRATDRPRKVPITAPTRTSTLRLGDAGVVGTSAGASTRNVVTVESMGSRGRSSSPTRLAVFSAMVSATIAAR